MNRLVAAASMGTALLLTLACATIVTEATRTETAARPPQRSDHPIEVVSGDRPDWPYRVIGSVRARVKLSESGDKVAPPAKVVQALKREGRAMGGDALLGLTVTPATGGGNYLSPTGTVLIGNSEIWTALVIVRAGPD